MDLIEKVQNAVVKAGSSYSEDRLNAYLDALKLEKELNNENAVWALEGMIENFKVACQNKLPLCDDTGIPHVLMEIGKNREIPKDFFNEINIGIAQGLDKLPGRPMAVKGNGIERINQSKGLFEEPSMVKPVSLLIEENDESSYGRSIAQDDDKIKVTVLLEGGGPEIRAKTYRIFHKRDSMRVFNEALDWLKESLSILGCTPSIPAIGIGRTHFEANALILRAMAHGNLNIQSDIEKYISDELNKTNIGPLGLGGRTTVLGSFVNIGSQRASGVRIVATRPACFVEPRVSSFEF
ncbi:fumarate hydratase [Methanobrevibacter olleyae]|uniref:Fumarate hydratase FumA n=1 Tax=Methanobrevibacter olleyae TaxID=294671 RepID=A0A126QYK7_METOL|nr:fumarate hydratase [Methanobrevibacter olleyae]AMK14894.1 fumarate hydratase FumA [Methanobrevibacter olleyae]